MALVRISHSLIDDVIMNIRRIRDRQYNVEITPQKPGTAPVDKNELYDMAVAKLWGNNAHLKPPAIPAAWCVTTQRLDIAIMAYHDGQRIRAFPEINVTREAVLPPGTRSGYGYVDVAFNLADFPPEFGERITAFLEAETAFKLKYAKLEDQIVSFLRGSKSLNEALKKYPNIGLYVSQHYKDRVEAKVERASKEHEEKLEASINGLDHALIASVGVIGALGS